MAAARLLEAPLNRQPQGLLDFFGIKSFGQYPSKLLEGVQPSLDLVQWYTELNSEDLRFETGTFGTQSPGSVIPWSVEPAQFLVAGGTQVPDTEAWLVLDFSAWKNFQSADSPAVITHLFFATGSPLTRWAPAQVIDGYKTVVGVAPDGHTVQTMLAKPLFLRPGTRLSLLGHGGTQLVATAAFGGMRVVRFRV